MNEHILNFGERGRLTGTLTLPPESSPAKSTAILLLNAGVIHRMGPHRLNVKLARDLARQGFAVLRLDLSGQGDSQTAESTLSFEQQAVADLKTAMDQLQRVTSAKKFALAGICSGAHHGIATAIEDERLSALWLMDPHTYPTLRTYWIRYLHRLQRAPLETLQGWAGRAWSVLTRRSADHQPGPGPGAPALALADDNPYASPSKAEFAAQIQALISKQVRLQVVYTGGMFWSHNHLKQWHDTFKSHGEVAHVPNELLPDVEHTAATLASQRKLIASVTRFTAQFD